MAGFYRRFGPNPGDPDYQPSPHLVDLRRLRQESDQLREELEVRREAKLAGVTVDQAAAALREIGKSGRMTAEEFAARLTASGIRFRAEVSAEPLPPITEALVPVAILRRPPWWRRLRAAWRRWWRA